MSKSSMFVARGPDAFLQKGITFSKASNEVVKLFDAFQHQLLGLYDNPEYGGLKSTFAKMKQTDPNFFFNELIECYFDNDENFNYLETEKNKNRTFPSHIKKESLTLYERMHHDAMLDFLRGKDHSALMKWQELLIHFPNDFLTSAFCFDYTIHCGKMREMMDIFGKMNSTMSESDPYYSFVLSREAFAEQEIGHYNLARKKCDKALALDPCNTWAGHTMSHLQLCAGDDPRKCVKYMTDKNNGVSRIEQWTVGRPIMFVHHYFHVALFEYEVDNFDECLRLYDENILGSLKTWNTSRFPLTDAIALLLRLDLSVRRCTGKNKEELIKKLESRWNELVLNHMAADFEKEGEKVKADCSSFWGRNVFYDSHLSLALGAAAKYKHRVCTQIWEDFKASVKKTFEQIVAIHQDSIKHHSGHLNSLKTHVNVTTQLVDAMDAFVNDDCDAIVDSLLPIHYEFQWIGGSVLQHQLYYQLLYYGLAKQNTEQSMEWIEFLQMSFKHFREE